MSIEMIEGLTHKPRMTGLPVDEAISAICENEPVAKSINL